MNNSAAIFRRQRILFMAMLLVMVLAPALLSAEISTGTDESAKLPYWHLQASGLSLRLVQRLPDQSRAFFAARGFNQQNTESIANSCIFQTVIKNIAHNSKKSIVNYDLSRWMILHKGRQSQLKTREQWRMDWQQKKVKQAARIAFEWAMLPTRQQYQVQDYNWGMTSFNLPPGSRFDLTVVWDIDGREQSATMKNVECAADLHLEPGEVG